MCTHLTKRGGTYYFRRVIPRELRPAMRGKAEFMVSLRTKDREAAKRLIPAHTIESDRLLDEARAVLISPAEASVAAPTRAFTEDEIEQMEHERRAEAETESRREELSDYIQFIRKRLKGSTRELPRDLRAFRYILEGHEFDTTLLRDQLTIARAEKSVLEERLRISLQPSTETSPLSAGDVPQSAELPLDRDRQGVMLDTAVVDLWAAERKPVQKGIDTHQAVARWFYDRIGRKPVNQITRKDVIAFKAALIAEGQSPANTKMKLSRLATLLQWAEDNDYAETNAAKGVTIKDTDAPKNKRKEFDSGALNNIFSSPVFTEGQRPAGGKGEAAYWLPLLALFTGARLEELGQLRPGDVAEETYFDADDNEQRAWVIHIREDAKDALKLKNAASERTVPVHSELQRLGFVRLVEAAKGTGDERLFPELKANIYGRLTAKWGEWFSGYLRGTCGVTDKRMVFHSFRHTFKHYARHAGVNEGVQRQLMGHSSGDVADDYGSGYSVHQLVQGVKMYRAPGLTLPS